MKKAKDWELTKTYGWGVIELYSKVLSNRGKRSFLILRQTLTYPPSIDGISDTWPMTAVTLPRSLSQVSFELEDFHTAKS